jgi:hypothetical protein
MAYPSVTYTFTNGTTASATEVNQNFTDLVNGMSDGTKDLNVNAITAAGTATFNGAVNLGNATGDDVTISGYVASAIIPKTDDTYDLGTAALAWQDAYFDGSVYTDSILELSSANGVVIDGVKCKDNNIEATTSGGLIIKDDGGNTCLSALDGGSVQIPTAPLTVGPFTLSNKFAGEFKGSGEQTQIAFGRTSASIGYGAIGADNSYSFVLQSAGTSGSTAIPTGTPILFVSHTGAMTAGNASLTTSHTIQNANTGDTVLNIKSISTSDRGRWAVFIVKGEADSTTAQKMVAFQVNAGGTNQGEIRADGGTSVAFAAISDRRLKTNIIPLEPMLDNINKLKPCTFEMIADGRQGVGFIAQDIEQVFPDAVSTEIDGYKSITGFGNTETRLIKAIQELSAKLDEANARIAALEAR